MCKRCRICNINAVIFKRENQTAEQLTDLTGFLGNITAHSYMSNDDGDGVYFNGSNKLIKGYEKINFIKYMEDIVTSDFLITHQRIATSGYSEEYVQPFEDEGCEFVLAHNGIMIDFIEEKHSDTYCFFYKFIEKFKSLKGNREKRIVKAIQKLLNKRDGSYSIILFDKKTQVLYYFKDFSTNINFYKSKNGKVLYITTDDNNKIFLNMFNMKFRELEIEDLTIYRISINKRVNICPIGKIKEKLFNYGGYNTKDTSSNMDNGGGYKDSEVGWKKPKRKKTDREIIFGKETIRWEDRVIDMRNDTEKDIENELEKKLKDLPLFTDEQLGFMGFVTAGWCKDCSVMTHLKNKYTGLILCEECIEEQRAELSWMQGEWNYEMCMTDYESGLQDYLMGFITAKEWEKQQNEFKIGEEFV